MLSEKKMLCWLSVLSLTGCRLRSPGQRPFCTSASTSVPGAPASSLATGSQELALNDGAEICAPDSVAVALLATRQPPAPRSVTSLAPVPVPAPVPAAAAVPVPAPAPARAGAAVFHAVRTDAVTVVAREACAPGACHAKDAATHAIEAH